jgi:hypothetical protein
MSENNIINNNIEKTNFEYNMNNIDENSSKFMEIIIITNLKKSMKK